MDEKYCTAFQAYKEILPHYKKKCEEVREYNNSVKWVLKYRKEFPREPTIPSFGVGMTSKELRKLVRLGMSALRKAPMYIPMSMNREELLKAVKVLAVENRYGFIDENTSEDDILHTLQDMGVLSDCSCYEARQTMEGSHSSFNARYWAEIDFGFAETLCNGVKNCPLKNGW